MNVLLSYFAELGSVGGVEVVVRTLAEAFRRSGCGAGITEMALERKPRRILPNGVPVWGLTAQSRLSFRPRSWASLARTTLQFTKVVREFSADVVHVHYPASQSVPVVCANLLPHTWRLVVTLHNSDIRVAPFSDPGIRSWQARLFQRADAVTAVSRELLSLAESMYPVISTKGQVIHNGIGAEWFTEEKADAPMQDFILFVGRLHRNKGIDVLLQAWKAVAAHVVPAQLWLAGGGLEEEHLRRMASELGIQQSVRFLGSKTRPELKRLYASARAVVLPSRNEGLPVVLLEAGACGAVSVATKVGGNAEIVVDGLNGFLVEAESPNALAAALLRVATLAPDKLQLMRHAARDVVQARFSEQNVVAEYLDLFASVIRSAEKRRPETAQSRQ